MAFSTWITQDCSLTHHSTNIERDEEISTTLENVIVRVYQIGIFKFRVFGARYKGYYGNIIMEIIDQLSPNLAKWCILVLSLNKRYVGILEIFIFEGRFWVREGPTTLFFFRKNGPKNEIIKNLNITKTPP